MSAINEKKNKPPDKPIDYFKCVKIPLKHILKNSDINLPKITDAVIKCNKIVINTLMFMKLYLLDYFEKNNKQTLFLKNMSNDTIIFKVKTSIYQNCLVRPCTGLIKPNSRQLITIIIYNEQEIKSRSEEHTSESSH